MAKIYRELFLKFKDKAKFKKKAKFFLIDFNGEYASRDSKRDDIIIEDKYKNSLCLSTRDSNGDKFPITSDTFNDPDFWVVFLEATEKTQTPFLRRAVGNDYLESRIKDEAMLKEYLAYLIFTSTTKGDRNLEKGVVVDLLTQVNRCLRGNTTVRTLLTDYERNLQFHSGQGKFFYRANPAIWADNDAFRTTAVNAKVEALQIDVGRISPTEQVRLMILLQYYDDIIRGFANREHLSPLITRMDKRMADLEKVIELKPDASGFDKKNITIVSLKDVNIQMRKILPLLFCKMLYNDKKAQNDDRNYLNIIIDEAHNILSESSERESEQWKDYRLETFEEIIKEGRKFGVFLTIASQRPSDISPTIISQLHNYFLHRLINNEDIKAVEKTISYLDKVSFEYLPILPTGTCIVAGLLANIPVVIDIGKISPEKHEPKNKTITLTHNWK